MGDVFKEQIVKKQPDARDLLKKIGILVSAAAISVLSFTLPVVASFAPFIVLAVGFGAYYLFSFLKIEYEYALTNNLLDIDAIYSQSRRKRIFSADVKNFEIMAHIDNKSVDFKNPEIVLNFSSGVTKPNTYAFLILDKGKRTKVVIEPNEMMLQAFSTVLTPRKLIK